MSDEKVTVQSELEQEAQVAESVAKLTRKTYAIKVPRNESLIYALKKALESLNNSAKKDKLTDQIKKAEQKLSEAEANLIEATLVPLSAMDLILIQSHVAEASIRAEAAAFDPDVRLFMLVKAEQCATVHLSVRKSNDLKTRYFAKQEDVVLLDEMTLRSIVLKYREAFVVEDRARKNS
ncbi:hypothetical protein LCGC14_1640100 [marine sediment metagenome]|uniref:Uncharacterized protein n=1 Tax=marine sediment metagenome TaxID=412755 RepID=A0A0F9KFQ8_9ZZZZ